MVSAPEVRALRTLGGVLVCLALAANERTLAAFLTPDGVLAPGTVWAVRGLELALLAAGVLLYLAAPALAAPVERANPFRDPARALWAIFLAGACLRVVVFAFLRPNNNDPHQDYIDFILREHRLPLANETLLGFQPPLYYLLASPWALLGSPKLTQVFSLGLSLAHLELLRRWIGTSRWIESARGRCHALCLVAFLPQFVLFGLFVSNDALAFPLGTLVLVLSLSALEQPRVRSLVRTSVAQGLALLTKGTALGNVPVLLGLLGLSGLQRRLSAPRLAGELALVTGLVLLVGGAKYVENQVHFGTPFVSNAELKQPWVALQAGTYRGRSSWTDVDVLALVRRPFLTQEILQHRESEPVMHSLPLLFYATFWYSYILESNFDATRAAPFHLIPRALYLVALPATALLLLGCARALAPLVRVRAWWRGDPALFARRAGELLVVGFLAANAALVLRWALKHDAWSFFQSRLLFGSFLSIALVYAWGFEALERRFPTLRALAGLAAAALYALLGAYWLVELGVQVRALL